MALVNWHSALVLLVVIMITIPKSISQSDYRGKHCSNTTTYAANSSYPNNLNTLLSSLSANATSNPNGFHSTSVGGGTNNTVYGLFLCRGDQTTSQCSNCVATAVREKPQRINCPRSKVGVIWYHECMLRYDSQAIAGILDQSYILEFFNSAAIPGNQSSFMELLGSTMHQVAAQAVNGPPETIAEKKYATKEVNFTSLIQLYSMVQCTPDLSASDCYQCLINVINQLQNKSNEGATLLSPSCNVRYEIYPFLNYGAFDSPSPSLLPTTNSSTGTRTGSKKVSTGVIVAIAVPVAVIAVMLLALGCFLILKKKSKKYAVMAVETREDVSIVESLQYDLDTLRLATNNFSSENKLGEGGFGGVYKGTLANGQTIAVKKLSKTSSQGTQEFKTEVLLVAKLQHRNLVRLLGFCLNGEEKLLVYEYVANRSLDGFLFGPPEMQGHLDWGRRYKIIEGIARGMLYLHQDSRLRIIHRDLKASNILLDENMNAKISDFGMARIFGVDQTQGDTSRIVGTYGYMAPEYAMQGLFSIKSDVYSFGVLVLEIICGKKNTIYYQPNGEDLFTNAWTLWRNAMPLDFVDATIKDACSIDEVMRCLHLALLCVQESVDARPTMATIVLALDSYSVTLSIPRQPMSFGMTESKLANAIVSEQSSKSSEHLSVNDVTITEFDPR